MQLPEGLLTEKSLLGDNEFMADARTFLAERNNQSFDSDQETFDAYLEHMRKQSVNEINAIGDLQYAQDANEESKKRFANLTNVFDRLQGEENWLSDKGWRKFLDYAEGVAKAPSTWIGLLTGGGGKAAALAAQQGIKWSIRKTLGQVVKGSLPAVAVEVPAGALQGAASEQTRTALGLEGDWKKGALLGGAGGAASGLIGGGIASAISIRSGKKAGDFLRKGKEAQVELTEQAAKLTDETLAEEVANPAIKIAEELQEEGVTDSTVYFARELDDLDEAQVAAGTEITDRIGSIPREKRNAIIASAIDLAKKLDFNLSDPKSRITQRLHDKIQDGTFRVEELQDIAQKYNLSMEEMANVFSADVSNAAKLLRQMRTLKEATGFKTAGESLEFGLKENQIKNMQNLLGKISPVSAEEVQRLNKLASMGSKALEVWRGLDKTRLSLMTSQITTTIRNAVNVGIRLPLHMIEFALTGGRWRDALAIPYNIFDKGSAEALAVAFDDAAPKQFRSLIRSAFDIEYQMGANSAFARVGRGLNILNTYVDNTVKKAVLLGEFRKIAGGNAELNEIISTGQLKNWLLKNQDAVKQGMNETLSVVYQKGYKAEDGVASFLAEKFIKTVAHSPYSPLLTQFVPFPRYLANQTEFIYKHLPLISLLAPISKSIAGKELGRGALRKRLAQNVSGVALLYGAMQLKVLQGPGVAWNQYRDMSGPEKGTVSDITALLGPFGFSQVAMDMIFRMSEGEIKNLVPIKSKKEFPTVDRFNIPELRDIFKALTGVQGRAGTGLYIIDTLAEDILDAADAINSDDEGQSLEATQKILGRFVANYINSALVPVGMFRDLQGTFDPEGRVINDNDNVDVFQYLINQTIRGLPNTAAIRNTEKFLGIPPALSSVLHSLRGPQVPQAFPGGQPRTRRTPLVRQFTGYTPIYGLEGIPPVEEELTNLGITRRQYFPYDKSKGPAFRNFHKLFMGIRADREITRLINRPEYQEMTNEQKRYELLNYVAQQRTEAGEQADLAVRESTKTASDTDRAIFESLNQQTKDYIKELYKSRTGRNLLGEKNPWGIALIINKDLKPMFGRSK